MKIPDLINGLYEFIGGLFILNHIRIILKEKEVKGLSILSVCYFTTWGFYNLYYYPHLNQMYSFYGACFLVLTNMLYIYLLIKYKK